MASQNLSILSAQKVMDLWQNEEPIALEIKSVDNLLHKQKTKEIIEQILIQEKKEEKIFQTVKNFVSKYRDHPIFRFDAFEVCGFKPKENNLSDVIAKLLDPRENHGFKGQFLFAFIDLLKRKNKEISIGKDDIKRNLNHISVSREKVEKNTRIDIEINALPHFLIFIEHKIRGGYETDNGKAQTIRQNKALKQKSEQYEIDYKKCIGVMLSPELDPPKARNFIKVHPREVVEEFMTVTKKQLRGSLIAKESISAFLTFFDFFSYKGH